VFEIAIDPVGGGGTLAGGGWSTTLEVGMENELAGAIDPAAPANYAAAQPGGKIPASCQFVDRHEPADGHQRAGPAGRCGRLADARSPKGDLTQRIRPRLPRDCSARSRTAPTRPPQTCAPGAG